MLSGVRMADLFQTTRWSLILASNGDGEPAHQALTQLCEAYWRPVYVYVRCQGFDADKAADLTQAFFLHLLEHHGFQKADVSRGRFRAFLVTCARNFLTNARQRDLTIRRGARKPHESLDAVEAEGAVALMAADGESSPEAMFERQWALKVVERAIERLRVNYVRRGQTEVFDALRPFLTSDAPEDSRTGGVGTDGVSDSATRAALHRLRQRFGEALRAEVEDTISDKDQVDGELRHLLQVLSS